MKLHLLRYFIVLAEELHFGRAAERLAITQPPLSVAIKSLEDELGVRLLLRDSKNVQLTEAGSALLVEARQIMERVARAADMTKAVSAGLRGRLSVGVTGSMFYREVSQIVRRFNELVPEMELSLREMSSAEQVKALLHGQLHAGFVNSGTLPPQLSSIPLKAHRFMCCLPAAHAMAHAKAVRLADLSEERWIMFARDVAPANHDNVIAVLNSAGIHPRASHAPRQWLTIISMVANGLGVALVPSFLTKTGFEHVRFLRLKDVRAESPASLAWNRADQSAALKTFVEVSKGILL